MKIPSSLSIPGIGALTTAAGIPAWVVALCVLAGVLVSLTPHVLAHRANQEREKTERDKARGIDDRRKEIWAVAITLPPAECAAVLGELARGLSQQEDPPPPADPATPSRSP